ncbi:MAG TPA: TIGR02710 family CRISPR-associated CARF protein [Candidatus Binataceae bacterium]|nr:TIGR02710 family CRISPR-associated CARF protein [Candidatus Binataceae bacterium]
MPNDSRYLLICTVGGSPEPIVETIRQWQPARLLLVSSAGTRAAAEEIAKGCGSLPPGAWNNIDVGDAQDLFEKCVSRMRGLNEEVIAWQRRGPAHQVVIGFTGGTKCMSAALALVARRWPCTFSYVTGKERTKGGVGIVVSGTEHRSTQNPWNALGYQAIEDACLLFDRQAFASAVEQLDSARRAVDDESVKRTLSTFHQLCEAYGLWDRFQHAAALSQLNAAIKNRNDLLAELGTTHGQAVVDSIERNRGSLRELAKPLSRLTVADLLANARRRRDEGRHDDAIARLYRAIESLAQLALAERHAIASTDDVALAMVPEPLRERWELRADRGKLRLGLQDAYELLDALGDEIGRAFKDLNLHDRERSPLAARNRSILAHGFQPASEQDFRRLWDAAMKLGRFEEHELPAFPRLTKS